FGAFLLDQIGRYVAGSDPERAALQLMFAGVVYAVIVTSTVSPTGAPRRNRDDLFLFAFGLLAATFVAVYVLYRYPASGDEWAYQYQADLFAHGRPYGPVPDCPSFHMSYWIYYWMGRAFCQYTPSWP